MSQKFFFYITAFLLFVAGTIHLLRLAIGFTISVGSFTYPIFFSWTEMITAFYLSYRGFKFTRKS